MTSATTPKTVELFGHGIQSEDEALSAITPGMLIERAVGGFQAHSTAGGVAEPLFANEMGLTGGSIDDDYEDGDVVVAKTYSPGSGIYGLVAAGAAAIADRAKLVSAGNGTLRAAGLDEVAVAQALEAVDNSAGGTAVRIKVVLISPQRTAAA